MTAKNLGQTNRLGVLCPCLVQTLIPKFLHSLQQSLSKGFREFRSQR